MNISPEHWFAEHILKFPWGKESTEVWITQKNRKRKRKFLPKK